MKYAFMTFSTKGMPIADVITLAARLGYDGIEPRIDGKHGNGFELDMTQQQRSQVRELAARAGVELCCISTSLRFALPGKAIETVEMAHERIDFCAEMGSPLMRVFGGELGPENCTREVAAEQMVRSLKAVAGHAAEKGVTVVLETHDDWADPNNVAGIMRAVNHPAIQVNWDVTHSRRYEDIPLETAFEIVKPWIRHCHFHDGIGTHRTDPPFRFVPMGTGEYDHRNVLRLLAGIDYKGYLSGEWINWEPGEIHLPRELQKMKEYEKELVLV